MGLHSRARLAALAAVVIVTAVASCAVIIQASEMRADRPEAQTARVSENIDPTPVQEEVSPAPKPETPEFEPSARGYHILIDKSGRRMTIYVSGKIFRSYSVGLGFTPEGHKTKRGDGRTPEGVYYVCRRNSASTFYRSLLVSYPSPADAKYGVETGRVGAETLNAVVWAYHRRSVPPQNTRLGGNICIHGEGGRSRPDTDWTAGCIAVTNKEMTDIFSLIPVGTPVTIRA